MVAFITHTRDKKSANGYRLHNCVVFLSKPIKTDVIAWKEADKETDKVMLEVAGREKQGYLELDDIRQFPCEDLRTIKVSISL